MLNLKALLNKMLQCCYKEGTSNGWHYKLYPNKWIEADAIHIESISNYSTYNGFSGYYYTIGTPFTMADTNYIVHSQWYVGGGFAVPATTFYDSSSTFRTYCLASSTGYQDVQVRMHLEGYIV